MSIPNRPPLQGVTVEEARALGMRVIETDTWDHGLIRQQLLDLLAVARRNDPHIWRMMRREAFDMRQDFAEVFADLNPAVVERVALYTAGRLQALGMALGGDPRAVGPAASIVGMAVVDDAWPQNGGTS